MVEKEKKKRYETEEILVFFDVNQKCQECLWKYNISSIQELEEGMLFGLMSNQIDIDALIPDYSYDIDGNFENAINSRNISNESEKDFLLENDEFKPLIFQKLNDNRIQELLSGKIFLVAPIEDDLGFHPVDSLKDFQETIKRYSKGNLVISQLEDNIFEVNDKFKAIYIEKTLPHQKELIKSLEELTQLGANLFKSDLQTLINEVQGIAEFDNMIYDMKRKRKIK